MDNQEIARELVRLAEDLVTERRNLRDMRREASGRISRATPIQNWMLSVLFGEMLDPSSREREAFADAVTRKCGRDIEAIAREIWPGVAIDEVSLSKQRVR